MTPAPRWDEHDVYCICFSQLERETIAERIRDNMHELAKTGRWLGGTTPTGFESEAIKALQWTERQRKPAS